MTTPWNPSPNPGGQNERLIRTVLGNFLAGLPIPGLTQVYRAMPPQTLIEWGAGPDFACVVLIEIERITESRMAYTGPDDPGGKDAEYEITLHIGHHAYSDDMWEQAQDDIDRIKDAIKDGLRGSGRNLGRPDVILQVGDWPAHASIVTVNDEPSWNDGTREQWAHMSFTATQYMQRQP